jgi:hypothetical protein
MKQNNPLLIFYGNREMETKNVVHQSMKFCNNSLNPNWQNETICLKSLCRGNKNFPVLLSVYHHKSNNKHILIGEVVTSVDDLMFARNERKGIKIHKNGKQTGEINVHMASIVNVEAKS